MGYRISLMEKPKLTKGVLVTLGALLIGSCGSEDSPYSFDQLVSMRLNDNPTIDGKRVTITSPLESTFSTACAAVVRQPCVTDTDGEDLSTYNLRNEYGHLVNSKTPPCNASKVFLKSTDEQSGLYEELVIDYTEHTEFYTLDAVKIDKAVFEAEVKFTKPVNYCEKTISKGLEIKLVEGEHEKLLEAFTEASQ